MAQKQEIQIRIGRLLSYITRATHTAARTIFPELKLFYFHFLSFTLSLAIALSATISLTRNSGSMTFSRSLLNLFNSLTEDERANTKEQTALRKSAEVSFASLRVWTHSRRSHRLHVEIFVSLAWSVNKKKRLKKTTMMKKEEEEEEEEEEKKKKIYSVYLIKFN